MFDKSLEIKLHKSLAQVYEKERMTTDFSKSYHSYWNSKILKFAPTYSLLVLNAGCGSGVLSEALEEHNYKVVNFDISLDMIKLAKKKMKNSFFVVADAERLPFKASVFGGLVCRALFHHLSDYRIAISQMSRVLKNDAFFVISEPNKNLLLAFPRFLIINLSKKFNKNHTSFDLKSFCEILGESRFSVSSYDYFGFLGFSILGFADISKIMFFLPAQKFLTRLFISLDEFLSKLPLIKKTSWHFVVFGKKV